MLIESQRENYTSVQLYIWLEINKNQIRIRDLELIPRSAARTFYLDHHRRESIEAGWPLDIWNLEPTSRD